MEILFPILFIVAIALTALSKQPKPKTPPKPIDEAINAAYWKGYQAGYNARIRELQNK